ncbi:recombinase [Escherichia coli]|nr:recombinase [Escherichia coli]
MISCEKLRRVNHMKKSLLIIPFLLVGCAKVSDYQASCEQRYQKHTATALAREEESKKGMDSAQVTGATSSYARKYCLNGLFGIDDAKDADTDEHKHQQNAAAKQSKPSPTPEQVLKAFTDAALQKNTVEELKQAFAKAWKMLEGTPEQHKAQDVYNIRRDELEGAAA